MQDLILDVSSIFFSLYLSRPLIKRTKRRPGKIQREEEKEFTSETKLLGSTATGSLFIIETIILKEKCSKMDKID